jgi:hypothetical protein
MIVLGLEFLEKRRLISDLVFCYRLLSGGFSLEYEQLFHTPEMLSMRSSSRTSNGKKLVVPPARLNVRKRSFCVRTVPVWNFLGSEVVNVRDSRSFVRRLHQIDLNTFLIVTME